MAHRTAPPGILVQPRQSWEWHVFCFYNPRIKPSDVDLSSADYYPASPASFMSASARASFFASSIIVAPILSFAQPYLPT
ncbi:uncharacterized protein L3040_009389 [Drepanopeziza brunnea f. sp. 'multigermtubi']|uniref:uncharacterized protein n=1 Tax=Drepanopeziza brunnea f. sp. 'multigermtubi' TaxID=698441 RepID=UPI0023A3C5BB|nr:hypothetical protein L3040_009389 [Drepanopeziza brunnea f. sp. 'multigermtubi']